MNNIVLRDVGSYGSDVDLGRGDVFFHRGSNGVNCLIVGRAESNVDSIWLIGDCDSMHVSDVGNSKQVVVEDRPIKGYVYDGVSRKLNKCDEKLFSEWCAEFDLDYDVDRGSLVDSPLDRVVMPGSSTKGRSFLNYVPAVALDTKGFDLDALISSDAITREKLMADLASSGDFSVIDYPVRKNGVVVSVKNPVVQIQIPCDYDVSENGLIELVVPMKSIFASKVESDVVEKECNRLGKSILRVGNSRFGSDEETSASVVERLSSNYGRNAMMRKDGTSSIYELYYLDCVNVNLGVGSTVKGVVVKDGKRVVEDFKRYDLAQDWNSRIKSISFGGKSLSDFVDSMNSGENEIVADFAVANGLNVQGSDVSNSMVVPKSCIISCDNINGVKQRNPVMVLWEPLSSNAVLINASMVQNLDDDVNCRVVFGDDVSKSSVGSLLRDKIGNILSFDSKFKDDSGTFRFVDIKASFDAWNVDYVLRSVSSDDIFKGSDLDDPSLKNSTLVRIANPYSATKESYVQVFSHRVVPDRDSNGRILEDRFNVCLGKEVSFSDSKDGPFSKKSSVSVREIYESSQLTLDCVPDKMFRSVTRDGKWMFSVPSLRGNDGRDIGVLLYKNDVNAYMLNGGLVPGRLSIRMDSKLKALDATTGKDLGYFVNAESVVEAFTSYMNGLRIHGSRDDTVAHVLPASLAVEKGDIGACFGNMLDGIDL